MAPGTAKKSTLPRQSRPSSAAVNSADHLELRRASSPSKKTSPSVPTRAEIRLMANSLGLLSDEGRLRILLLLEQSSRNVAALGEALGQDRHSLSHHLRILRVSGLILATRDGRRVEYSLTPRGRIGVKTARLVIA